MRLVRLILLIVAAAFIAIGVAQNEIAIVQTKSINICLECIGIG